MPRAWIHDVLLPDDDSEMNILKAERRNEAIQMRDRDIVLAHERLDNIDRWLLMWTRLPLWRRLRWLLLGR